MRKFILIVPLLFVSVAAYAASETIEQIKPAEKPAVATEPPARTNSETTTKDTTKKVSKTNTDTAAPPRTRKAAGPAANPRSARRPVSPSGESLPSNEDEARRMGAKYGITW
jgi:hypothetical protein